MPDQLQSLLVVKAVPPGVPPGLVARPRLDDLLDKAVQRPMTLISGGPGAGKTLAVASWAINGSVPGPVAWLTLDVGDNQPRAFWAGLLAALQRSGALPADSPLNDLIPTASFSTSEAIGIRNRIAELPTAVVLVLDDFHLVTAEPVLAAFERMIEYLPEQLRLVILSRSDPSLRLHRLRVSGELTEIRTADLAFTEQETALLFDDAGIQLEPGHVRVLTEHTQGWPAGLRLASMSLDPDDLDAGIARFSGSDRSVADYLVSEVVDGLPDRDRQFLLRAALPEKISGPLADRLTDRTDGQRMLASLVAANAFVVELGDHGEWFTFHPLMRELLRHRLVMEQPQQVIELHRRAATWMAEHGEPIESIRHWLQADDFEGAGRMLLTVLPRLLAVDGPELTAVIEPLARTASYAPSLSSLLASAGCHLQRRESVAAIARDARDAREYLDQAPPDIRASAEAVITLFEMAAARTRGDALTVSHKAREVLGLVERTPRPLMVAGPHYRVIAVSNLGSAALWNDRFDEAEEHLAAAELDTVELQLQMVHLNATGHRAVLEAMRGRNRQADRRARQALRIIDRRGWSSELQALATYLSLALVALSRHQLDAAGGIIERGLSLSSGQADRSNRLGLAIAAVDLAVLRGDAAAATTADARLQNGIDRTPDVSDMLRRWSSVASAQVMLLHKRPADVVDRLDQPDDGGGFAAAWERVYLARAQLELGQLAPAARLIAPLVGAGQTHLEQSVHARLLGAVIEGRQHRDSAALDSVTAAIELAQPELIRRPFLHQPGAAELLQRYQRLGGRRTAFVGELLDKLVRPSSSPAENPLLLENLTEREMIVLHYLPTMLKAGEIASDLFVSVNTVKAHLRSMYRKLGVSNRREAVERARSVGLLK